MPCSPALCTMSIGELVPPCVLNAQDVLRDLFQAPLLPAAFSAGFPSAATQPGELPRCLQLGQRGCSCHEMQQCTRKMAAD